MPSNPRKVHGRKEGMSRSTAKVSDTDSDDSDIPSLIPCTDDEDSDEEEYRKKPATKAKGKGKSTAKPKSNAECADMWYKMNKDEKERHIHVMKVYLLSPFLFGQVYQEDKWINWAYESGLLLSKSSFEIRALEEKHFDAVDLIETAFNKLVDNALWKNKDGLVKTLDIIGSSGLSMSQHLDKAVTCAESFLAFTNLRDKIKLKPGITKKQGDVALLLAHNQVSDHIKQLAGGVDLVEQFNKRCRKEEDQTTDKKKEGNDAFSNGKFTAAISVYTRALHMSPYNHVLYGNRAQSYLKTKDLWCALTDGRRAILLKEDWHKAQYRYAQAFFELGKVIRAKETNRAARKICSERKDLETQYERFQRGTQATNNEMKGKTADSKKTAKHSKIPDDLPALVDPNSSDTSRNSDDDYGPPDLVEMEEEDSADSTHVESEDLNSDSSDGYESDDSSARKKGISVSVSKKRRPSRKVRQALRETKLDKAKEEEKAKKEEKEKKMAELAAKKENKKTEKRNKNTKATQLDQNGNSQRKREFSAYLKQGSKAILEKKCMLAVRNYGEAMTILEQHDFQYQVFDLKEIDFVILLYGFGAAYLELGGHEELREAKKQFEIILVKHNNVVFPLAYLGTGRVFYKQNRFTEALEHLEQGLAVVNKLGEDLASYRWPGSQVIIDETKPGKLLSAIETLIRICRHPPRPDAVCRSAECQNKSQIYLTDTDYKGYIRLICDEECKVDFHPVCWKKQKSTFEEKAGDKDFLEDTCMTPDCGGTVINVQIFDTDGLKTEFKHEKLNEKVETKPKGAKQNKVKASAIGAKQKKKKEKDDVKIEDTTPPDTDTGEEKEPVRPAVTGPSLLTEEKPFKEDHAQLDKEAHGPFDTDAGMQTGEGVFILKKEDEEEPSKGGKAKTKKKKLKNTQTLGEFLNDRGGQQIFRPGFGEIADDLDEITIPKGQFEFVPPPPGWSQHEMEAPFAIPSHLQGDAAHLEAHYRDGGLTVFSTPPVTAPEPQIDLKAVTDYVSSMLQEILRVNGPLELADPNIMQPLSMLPDNYQEIISNAGGLRPILEQSEKFVFQGNKVMLPEDKDFEDLVKTLKPQTDNPFLERINGTKDANLENGFHDIKSIGDSDKIGSSEELAFHSSSPVLFKTATSPPFNPDAKEFVPSSSQTDLLANSSLRTSLGSDSSTLKDAELVDDQIEEDDTITEEPEPISVDSKVENVLESVVESDAKDTETKTKTENGTQEEINVDSSSDAGAALKAESQDVDGKNVEDFDGKNVKDLDGKNVEDSERDQTQDTPAVEPVKDTVSVSPVVNEVATLAQPSHKRTGSNNSASDQVITSKAKSVQTQPNVKSKGVGTDPIPEPFKAEYHRAAAEKDALQARLQENTDRLNALLNKNSAEVDKVKKKLSDALQDKEKCSKELQDLKQKNTEEIRKLRQQCEDKEDKIKTLTKKLQQDADDKSSVINNLKKELASCKGQFISEKDSWSKERSEKEDLLKNSKLQHQQQQARAQDAEIKLLELRRDVGLRFLERAYQESHITINNLMQAVNARIAGPKVEELITAWKNYTAECHQRVVQCKATFNEQIELLKTGRTLASVPQLTIPGPPPYPGIPVLQSLVPGQQQNQPQPPVDNNTPTSRASDPPLPNAPAVAPAGGPVAGAAPAGAGAVVAAAVNGDKPTDAGRVAAAAAAAALSAAAAAPVAVAAVDKARPSNSFEKIMLRLSTMYPNFTRLELTGFIKEVRHNKHGSLTGLSLEDIVTSVSELVEQKKKAGLLRVGPAPQTNSPTTQRSTKPAMVPQANQPPQAIQALKPMAPELHKSVFGGGSYEEDPCVICHEDMNASSDIVTLECGHKYHSPCIRKWLVGEQSTCPTCRVHALLPDEFPRLK